MHWFWLKLLSKRGQYTVRNNDGCFNSLHRLTEDLFSPRLLAAGTALGTKGIKQCLPIKCQSAYCLLTVTSLHQSATTVWAPIVTREFCDSKWQRYENIQIILHLGQNHVYLHLSLVSIRSVRCHQYWNTGVALPFRDLRQLTTDAKHYTFCVNGMKNAHRLS